MVHTFKLSYSGGVQQVFFHGYVLVKGNLRSNVKEASLAESRIYRSIRQFSIRGFFICLERLAVEQSRGLVMGCHC